MAQPMRERPDAANGTDYDPSYRSSVYDYTPKHNPGAKCDPYYYSDDSSDYDNAPRYNPTTFYYRTADDNCPPIVNTTPYESRTHPYLYNLPRRRH